MLVSKSQVKYIQSLGHKKFRDEEGVFVAEGPKIVGELLRIPGLQCRHLYALREWIAGGSAGISAQVRIAEERGGIPGEERIAGGSAGIHAQEVGVAELGRLSLLSTPNQVVAVFAKPVFPPPDLTTGITLVLDGIQDPGNLGTLVRIADWFGLQGVVCSPDCADLYNPKTIQSTMGSVGRVPVVYGDLVAMVKGNPDIPVYAAALGGSDLYAMQRIDRGLIVIGNESKGIREGLKALATARITIPGHGQAESLNAAVAAGIVLSQLVNGRR